MYLTITLDTLVLTSDTQIDKKSSRCLEKSKGSTYTEVYNKRKKGNNRKVKNAMVFSYQNCSDLL